MSENTQAPGWHVYIVRCRTGTLYTGITTDLERRVREHNRGKGSKYTHSRLPVRLVYSEPYPDRSSAQSREAWIKGLTRKKKESLFNPSQSGWVYSDTKNGH